MGKFIINKIGVLLIIIVTTLFLGWALNPFLGALFFLPSVLFFVIKFIVDLIKLT